MRNRRRNQRKPTKQKAWVAKAPLDKQSCPGGGEKKIIEEIYSNIASAEVGNGSCVGLRERGYCSLFNVNGGKLTVGYVRQCDVRHLPTLAVVQTAWDACTSVPLYIGCGDCIRSSLCMQSGEGFDICHK